MSYQEFLVACLTGNRATVNSILANTSNCLPYVTSNQGVSLVNAALSGDLYLIKKISELSRSSKHTNEVGLYTYTALAEAGHLDAMKWFNTYANCSDAPIPNNIFIEAYWVACSHQKTDVIFWLERILAHRFKTQYDCGEKCVICFDDTRGRMWSTACGHKFHIVCLLTWLEKRSNCPMCRAEVCCYKHKE